MKKILVTGGSGFIGSHICEFLLKKNFKVKVIDNLSTGNKNNINHLINNPNFEFVYGDVCNLENVRKVCTDIDMICHQAAIGSVPKSIVDPLTSHNSNVNGFLNILLVAKENNIKRIVYASSSSVYGDNELLPKKEEVIGKQLSPYAITKYIDELYANIFYKLYNIETIGLRYFNVFGPRQDPNGAYAAVIPKFISAIVNNKPVIINGNGKHSRDFTFVENVVYGNYLALTTDNDKSFGQIFNIACGGQYTILELFNIIKKNLNSSADPIFGENRAGDILHSNADITKSQNYLGYNVIKTFEEGIIETIKYYQK